MLCARYTQALGEFLIYLAGFSESMLRFAVASQIN